MLVMERAMASHSSTLAWKIPWKDEPGRLQSMGSQRVGHDRDFTFTFCFHVLAIVSGASVNIGVHVSPWIAVLSRYMSRNGIAAPYGEEGSGIPLQYPCLESRMNGGAW